MRVLLIFPPSISAILNILGTTSPPLGLAYLASSLEREGVNVRILDAQALNLSFDEIEREIRDWKPEVVGATGATPACFDALRVLEIAKSYGAKTVLGGPHFSFTDVETLENYPFVDFVVRGEGEETVVELISALERGGEVSEVLGLTYRDGGTVRKNQDRPLIKDIDSIPFPAFHLLPMNRYTFGGYHYATVMTSRGCPYNCVFCASSKLFGKRWRGRSPRNVVDELKHLAESYRVRNIEFLDDTFTLNQRRAEKICDEIINRRLDIVWNCSSRVNTISQSLLEKMKKAGCDSIYYGVESGSQEILGRMKKGTTLNQTIRAFKKTKRVGMEIIGSFIIGFPGETINTIKKTISFAKFLKPDYAQFTICTPYPGTELFQIIENTDIMQLFTKDWSKYDALKPVFTINDDSYPSPSELIKWVKKAYLNFYVSPSFLFQQLKKKRFIVWRKVLNAFKNYIKGNIRF
ncbi:MAG: B12-binding domain-containing radical SAM protein [Candidatus Jordarchaeum sp.]|uniref:B12-binding domain-containing radical SAM protein n=1 Tax=Candidatus Jordarchaeum sp. TaxID=2823881 RepID=UPI0040491FB4